MEPSENMLYSQRVGARMFGLRELASRPVALAAGVTVAILLVATVALWVRYGTAVFYEMIVAGLAACI
jgi:hypothetical protein